SHSLVKEPGRPRASRQATGAPGRRANRCGPVTGRRAPDGPQPPPDHPIPADAPIARPGGGRTAPSRRPTTAAVENDPAAEDVPPRPPPPVPRPLSATAVRPARIADRLSALHCKAILSGGQPLRAVASGTAPTGEGHGRPGTPVAGPQMGAGHPLGLTQVAPIT